MSGSQGSQARGTTSSSAVSKILKGEYDVLVILCLSGLYKVYWKGVWKLFLLETRRFHSITLDLHSEGPRFDTCSDLFADFSVQFGISSETKVKIWKYLPPSPPLIFRQVFCLLTAITMIILSQQVGSALWYIQCLGSRCISILLAQVPF